jgi:hypothetical protein
LRCGLLVLAGCGGSSGSSKAHYIANADAIRTTAQRIPQR